MPERSAQTGVGAPLGRTLMIQGTSSHAGKTTLVAALCRLYAQAGYRVAPFKAQNMSNNAAVTESGGEVGRAQAMQAMAAGVTVTVDMNPVLLKPQSDQTSQIVVLGKVRHTRNAREYYELRAELWPIVTGALDRLRAEYDLVIIEGAGSPAEINLAQYDIVNMRVARYANSPVLLVGDIERGGVFAALYGTVALLPPEESALIKGFVINKFRGDATLLDPGFDMMFDRTGIKTLGVLPWLDLNRVPAEDALEWDVLRNRGDGDSVIDIAIIRLPRIANLDEFQPLAIEPGVRVRFIGDADDLGAPDLIIIPGTKSTLADLAWLRERHLAQKIISARNNGVPVFGICGGFQMLGTRVSDVDGVEGHGTAEGLGLLPVQTAFASEKVTKQVRARVASSTALWNLEEIKDTTLDAYEIHMGRTERSGDDACTSPFVIGDEVDGLASADGRVVGTYMHGLLENDTLRRTMVRTLAARKGVQLPDSDDRDNIDAALNRLAKSVSENLDMEAIGSLVGMSLMSTR